MSQRRQTISIQLGHYANFVGTHWWNLQEASFCYDQSKAGCSEIDHDVLFREGRNPKGEVTYTPRLLAVDLKDSLHSLREEGTLYNVPSKQHGPSAWLGKVDVAKAESSKKNAFLQDIENEEQCLYPDVKDSPLSLDEDKDICQDELLPPAKNSSTTQRYRWQNYDLDSSVCVWSDFLRIHLHPRSIKLVENYHHMNFNEPFESFKCGRQAYSECQLGDSFEQHLRFFAEECDYLQGFHILSDGYDGFAGLSSSVLQHLDDEYGTKVRLCFPLFQGECRPLNHTKTRAGEIQQLLTTMQCINDLVSHGSLFCPLSTGSSLMPGSHSVIFPYVKYKPLLPYHSSSILASALETISVPTRLYSKAVSLVELSQGIVFGGRKLVALSVCLPLPLKKDAFLLDEIQNTSTEIKLTSLTPMCTPQNGTEVKMAVLRGIPKARMDRYQDRNGFSPEEIFGHCLSLCGYHTHTNSRLLTVIQEPCHVGPPYPGIFSGTITREGWLGETTRAAHAGVSSIPTAAAFLNTDSAAHLVYDILDQATKCNMKKYCYLDEVESDELQQIIDNLNCLAENYISRVS